MTSPDPFVWGFATLPKAHSAAGENEDALGVDAKKGRFAVADGATEGWQSGAWSKALVQAYLKHAPTPLDFVSWFDKLRQSWQPPPIDGPTTWYAEEKQSQGSFATLLGLQFVKAKSGGLAWKAVALGDSCLLVTRNGELFSCWPIETAEGFHSRPALLPSGRMVEVPEPEWLAGRCQPGDIFILATDAVARGLLQMACPAVWRKMDSALERSHATERTESLLELIKDCQARHNDDVTLLAVKLTPDREPE